MGQNYLGGENSPKINTFLVAVGWNFKKMMKKLEGEKIIGFFRISDFCLRNQLLS